MKKFLLVCFSLLLLHNVGWAQERTISGTVTAAEDGSALPGVNVVLKGTSNGTVTDTDGSYKLNVPSEGGTLVFSFIGLQGQEIVIGDQTVINANLSSDVQQLTEVIVTAQGVEREQKALGYATTTISSNTLADKPETDVGRALQGRTPGLQILNSSGLAGSGSRINIRGNSSITGNTQPLWVVNGVPINTDANDINANFQDGQVAPTRFLDIDPNNIESMTVLRGLSATTLYGSQGRNGVILITTKTGSSKGQQNKFEGSITQSYFAVQAVLPQYQNKWANGFDGAYGEFFSNWGSLFNGKPTGVRHPYNEWADLFPEHPEFAVTGLDVQEGQTLPGYIPEPQPNNVKDFFRTGASSTTSLTLGTKTEFGNMSFSYSHLDESGFVINNKVRRDNFSLGGSSKLTDKLTLGSTFNFVRTDFETPPSGAGQGSNSAGGPSIFAEIFYTPRNIDLTNWPWENPIDHSSVYYRNDKGISNPYWLAHNTLQTNLTNRFYSSSNLNYKFTDWLNVSYRLGWDTYSERQTYWINKGAGPTFDTNLTPGAYRSTSGISNIFDHTVLASFDKDLSETLNLTAVAGFNFRRNTYVQEGLESLGQVVYGLIEHRNFTSTQAKDFRGINLNYQRNSTIAGAYFEANLGFKNMLYATVSGRNDWTSTLEKQNRSLFYPGASISFIPTVAFPNIGATFLDFLKIRLAYGTSANFGTPYNTAPYLTLNSQNRIDFAGNVVTSRLATLLANPNLKPELLTETELGLESQLFENRIRLNLSFYSRLAKDQIIQRPLDPSTGYLNTYINAGEISNKGIEASLTVTPIKTADWNWDITANFTRNVSKVESLPDGSDEILVNGYTNLGNFAIEGEPLNIIKGSYTERSPDGELIINDAGNYKQANEIGIIANPNPKWLGSLITSLSFKSLSFGMQWDYVYGGQILSYTAATMVGRGVAKDLEDFDPTLPLILPGVLEQFDENGIVNGYVPNNIPLTTAGVFFGNTIIGGGPYDRGIYDATRVRFREVSFTYTLPKTWVSKLKLRGINVSLLGNNLWFRAINAPKYSRADFDRTAFGTNNGAGFDYLGGPSARRFGATIKLTF
jgi:TonB-linked SusC/RagA family outer membrane protein